MTQTEIPEEITDQLDSWESEDALRAYVENIGMEYAAQDWDATLEQFREAYQGDWATFISFAEQLAEDIGLLSEMPESLQAYFDMEAWARDLELGGDYYTVDSVGGVYVFRSL